MMSSHMDRTSEDARETTYLSNFDEYTTFSFSGVTLKFLTGKG